MKKRILLSIISCVVAVLSCMTFSACDSGGGSPMTAGEAENILMAAMNNSASKDIIMAMSEIDGDYNPDGADFFWIADDRTLYQKSYNENDSVTQMWYKSSGSIWKKYSFNADGVNGKYEKMTTTTLSSTNTPRDHIVKQTYDQMTYIFVSGSGNTNNATLTYKTGTQHTWKFIVKNGVLDVVEHYENSTKTDELKFLYDDAVTEEIPIVPTGVNWIDRDNPGGGGEW